jgi:hypothetical protein
MSIDTLALVALLLAAFPAALCSLNLLVYRPIRNRNPQAASPVSVLIPARNEEENLGATLQAVLESRGCRFEVVVLDDHSTDRTAQIVRELADRDQRVRLASAPPLPPGWCGKQHACQVLSKLGRHPLLVFIDADVRLEPDALARMASVVEPPPAGFPTGREHSSGWRFPLPRMETVAPALASGVPRQELGTFSERLLIPLIHFILLGFLPMHAMRRTRWPAMSAGCGQLFIARRDAYERCGGHAVLRDSLHDGIRLPRAFRKAGFATDLFDATDLAACRMYRTNADAWRGLGKNATEGLAAPGTIVPMTGLLLGGQVLPFVLLALAPALSPQGLALAAAAIAAAYIPRLIAVRLFRQPLGSALLHPVGVLALLVIQWHAFIRCFAGRPAVWKGRSYPVRETVRAA